MRGVTELDNKLFIVCANSSIQVYDAQTFNKLSVIKVKGLIDPCDIVVCRDDHQLYVADHDRIWRVSAADPHQSENWLTTESTERGLTLSVKSRRLLVTSPPRHLRLYDITNKELLCVVECSEKMEFVCNAIETSRGTFVVGHRDMSHECSRRLNESYVHVSIKCFLLSCILFSNIAPTLTNCFQILVVINIKFKCHTTTWVAYMYDYFPVSLS